MPIGGRHGVKILDTAAFVKLVDTSVTLACVIVPSYVAKVTRAKEHLIDLKSAVDQYTASDPYAMSERVEGKKKRRVRRLAFTEDPANTEIPIIAADVIYNLRSSLDHLMSALVANKDRGSAMFPIFFDGVWEAIVPGENQQRVKERTRWASDIKTLPDGAVALLKQLQPTDGSGNDTEVNMLTLVNRLSNRDRHEKLPVVAAGMRYMIVRYTLPDGTARVGKGIPDADSIFQDQAKLDIPDHTMNVEIKGIPVVAISVGNEQRYIEIPDRLGVAVRYIEEQIVPRFIPFVRP